MTGRLRFAQVGTDLLEHPKLGALERRLGNDERAAFHLILTWLHFARFYVDGRMPDTDDARRSLEAAARWRGEPGALVDALVEVGFLERRRSGLVVHDWRSWTGSYAEKRDRDRAAKRAKRAEERRERRSDVRATSRDVVAQKEKEKEITSQQQPPPRGEWPESTRLAQALAERWQTEFPDRTIAIALPSRERRDEVEAAIVRLGAGEALAVCIEDTRNAFRGDRLDGPPASLGFYADRLIAAARRSAP